MLERILIGLVIGFIGGFFLIKQKGEESSEISVTGLIIIIVSMAFIGASFMFGGLYGLMAIGEIVIGFTIASTFFEKSSNNNIDHLTDGKLQKEQVFRSIQVLIYFNRNGKNELYNPPVYIKTKQKKHRSDFVDVYIFENKMYASPSSAPEHISLTKRVLAFLTSALVQESRSTEVWKPTSQLELEEATEIGYTISIEYDQCECIAEETRTSWNMFGSDWFTCCRIRGKFKFMNEIREGDVYLCLGGYKAKSSALLKTLRNMMINYSVIRVPYGTWLVNIGFKR